MLTVQFIDDCMIAFQQGMMDEEYKNPYIDQIFWACYHSGWNVKALLHNNSLTLDLEKKSGN